MDLHIFHCSEDPSVYAFSTDISGQNIPKHTCSGEWQFWRSAIIEKDPQNPGSLAEDIVNGIETLNYHISAASTLLDQFLANSL